MKKLFKIAVLLTMAVVLIPACSKDDNNGGGTLNPPEDSNLTFQVNGVSFEMIYVEGGTFWMGATPEQGDDPDDDEYPVHQVTLDSYYIGKFEVTQELWQAVMNENPSQFTHVDSIGYLADTAVMNENPSQFTHVDSIGYLADTAVIDENSIQFTPENGYDNSLQRPVESVNWNKCQRFIKKLNQMTGKRFALPTEAQWEFAARGGNKSKGYKYSGSNNIDDVAWYDGNSNDQIHTVGQKQANELGIYDMSGNVWEWCLDRYRETYSSSSQQDPTGPFIGFCRVIRGGSWYNRNSSYCRVSYRNNCNPVKGYYNYGLRLVLVP